MFTETPFTNPAAPSLVLPAVFPAAGTAGPSAIALPLAVNPDVQMPYSHQWSVTVEHERWNTGFRVSYVGTLGREMWYTRDVNAPEADGRLYVEKPRPFPQYPSITYADNGASHDYHGVTLEGGATIFGRPVLPGGLHSREGHDRDGRMVQRNRGPVRSGARTRP